jgi:hypothetical protein
MAYAPLAGSNVTGTKVPYRLWAYLRHFHLHASSKFATHSDCRIQGLLLQAEEIRWVYSAFQCKMVFDYS